MAIWRRTFGEKPFILGEKTSWITLLFCSRQDSTYHDLNYTICGAHAGTRYSSVCPPFHHDESIRRSITFRAVIGLFVVVVVVVVVVFIVVYYFLINFFLNFFLQMVCSMLIYLYKGERDVAP